MKLLSFLMRKIRPRRITSRQVNRLIPMYELNQYLTYPPQELSKAQRPAIILTALFRLYSKENKILSGYDTRSPGQFALDRLNEQGPVKLSERGKEMLCRSYNDAVLAMLKHLKYDPTCALVPLPSVGFTLSVVEKRSPRTVAMVKVSWREYYLDGVPVSYDDIQADLTKALLGKKCTSLFFAKLDLMVNLTTHLPDSCKNYDKWLNEKSDELITLLE